MIKKIVGGVLIAVLIALFVIMTHTKERVGISNKELVAPSGSVIHTGTNGGVTWEIYENNHLLFKPTNGHEGTFDDMNWWYSDTDWHRYRETVTSVSFSPGVETGSSVRRMLYRFEKVTELDLNGLDTQNTIDMESMFEDMSSLTELDLSKASNFDTSKVTNMKSMFKGLSKLTELDLSKAANFDTRQVTTMNSMFYGISSLTELDLSKASNFDTSKVTDMSYMFTGLSRLTELDLSKASNFEIIYS